MKTFILGRWWRSHHSLAREGLRIFRFCVMPWKDAPEPTIKHFLGRQSWLGSRFSSQYRTLDTIDGEPMEFEWNFSQDSPHCSSATKSKSSCPKMSDEPEECKGRIIFMSMFNDISWGSQDNEKECESTTNFVSIYAWRFSPGRWSFFGPGSEKKCILLMIANHKGNGTESLNWWW